MNSAGDKRLFIVLHPLGACCAVARSAGEALRKSYVPGGYRQALAVFEDSLVMKGRDAGTSAFVAFIGEPAALAKGGAS